MNDISIMGIINIGSKSFSQDSIKDINQLKDKAMEMIENKVDIIDIGAESSNPKMVDSDFLGPEKEWELIEKAISAILPICKQNDVLLSVDTWRPKTAFKAAQMGIDIINDVTGLQENEMIDHIIQFGLIAIANRSLGIMTHHNKIEGNPIDIFREWAGKLIEKLHLKGVNINNIFLDPGIGYNIDPNQSMKIISNINQIQKIANTGLCIGHSRKSLFNPYTSVSFQERDIETLAASIFIMMQYKGTKPLILRVHNTEMHKRAMKIINAMSNLVIDE